MLFTSGVFMFVFLPVVIAGYFLLPGTQLRNAYLLLASLVFYWWGETELGWLLVGSIVINYLCAIAIEGSRNRFLATTALIVGLSLNLGCLAWFKYSGFLVSNINVLLQSMQSPTIASPQAHLPLGISFYVFHSISYLVDVFRRAAPAQRNPVNLALYITLFPQLIVGPIVRYHSIASQLSKRTINSQLFGEGVERFIIGLAKKLLIANTLAGPADAIFAIPGNTVTPAVAWIGIICFTLQLYFDFSGYTDMAIGLGQMFGFRLPENFNFPYIATSISELWRRWHMSLSTWFRDYVYIPLGGSRRGSFRTGLNLIFVFFLCGLWHGAGWNFILFGLYHGAFVIGEKLGLLTILERCWRPVQHVYMLVAWMVGLVLFRTDTLTHAGHFWSAMAGLHHGDSLNCNVFLYFDQEHLLIALVAALFCVPFDKYRSLWRRLHSLGPLPQLPIRGLAMSSAKLSVVTLLLSLCILEIAAGTYRPFIYFRF